jgi:Zn-dependent protease with chaperone function
MQSTPSPAFIRARWFNGQSSRGREVLLTLEPGRKGPTLRLHTLDQAHAASRHFEHAEVEWPPVWSSKRAPAVVTVSLNDAGTLEIDTPQAWQDALTLAGQRPSLTQRMQTHWPVFLGVLLVAAIGLAAFYRYGTPWAATQITRHVPLDWELSLTERAMEQLDQGYLKPSKLLPERQAGLRRQFDALLSRMSPELKRYPSYAPRFSLAFRSGMGANAFALPGGTVVMTDALVETAAKSGLSDDALIGVLAHEIGHVVHRHTTRMLVEQGVLNIGLGVALGDVSSVVSFASTLLTGLAYRRQHEAEADCFAIALMRQAQLPTGPMADLLLNISAAREGPRKDQPADKAKAERGSFSGWFSSHPETRQRAEQLKAGQALGCPA